MYQLHIIRCGAIIAPGTSDSVFSDVVRLINCYIIIIIIIIIASEF